MLDGAPKWRHIGAMCDSSKISSVRSLDRINLRLPGETFEEIDTARAARAGNVSRNTWITEAIEEKLARDRTRTPQEHSDRSRHG
jgi:metal-responsive CopG/Arc/MetJ family transcriptional regulator